ncbi:hypothetical protein ACJX0J_035414, partial [Zea mays]
MLTTHLDKNRSLYEGYNKETLEVAHVMFSTESKPPDTKLFLSTSLHKYDITILMKTHIIWNISLGLRSYYFYGILLLDPLTSIVNWFDACCLGIYMMFMGVFNIRSKKSQDRKMKLIYLFVLMSHFA